LGATTQTEWATAQPEGTEVIMDNRVLTNEVFERLKPQVIEFLKTQPSIVTWQFRELSGLNHDEASLFFKRMVADGFLLRVGQTCGTKYITASRVD
jgi:hypothetical protein